MPYNANFIAKPGHEVCICLFLEFQFLTSSKSCGHHYSKASILELLKNKKNNAQLSCPVTGCTAKVTQKSLEEDKDVELLVQRELAKQNNAESDEEDDVIDI